MLLLLNVEFKLRQYFAAYLIREWRSNENMALLRYTMSIRHAALRKVLDFQMHNMIHSWHQAMLDATCIDATNCKLSG